MGHILCRGKSLLRSSEIRGFKGQCGWSTGHSTLLAQRLTPSGFLPGASETEVTGGGLLC